MSFFAVFLALVLEQVKPLPRDNWVHDTLASWVGWTGRNFDAGKPASSGPSPCWCRRPWPA
jgi:adenosylcobinamide-phosphate synthase